jgi:hypothetical protein
MWVIIKTDNRQRGDDSVQAVLGPYESHDGALNDCQQLRAYLPPECSTHEDNPIDFGVWEIQTPYKECGGCGRINNTEEVI